jgi:hypothetical protein
MKFQWTMGVAALAAMASPGCQSKLDWKPMPEPLAHFPLAPLEWRTAPALQGLRLLETPAGIQLVGSTLSNRTGFPQYATSLTAVTVPAEPPLASIPLFTIEQMLPAPPRWDVVFEAPKNAYRCVIEQAGGAMNILSLRSQSGENVGLTAAHPLESFSQPRFVRKEPAGHRPSVSAVLDHKALVVFSGELTGRQGGYTRLGDWTDGLLVSTGNGYVVFGKRSGSGPAREGILPGLLECVRLDDRFHPVSKPVHPFGPQTLVYEFDADRILGAVGEEQFAAVATGPHGTILARGRLAEGEFTRIRLGGVFNPERITRPAILASQAHLAVALLEAGQTTSARVWCGLAAVPPN